MIDADPCGSCPACAVVGPSDQAPGWYRALERVDRLTVREHEIFCLLAAGNTNDELADALFVSERTVRAHLAQIMTKLELRSRLQAALASYVYRQKDRRFRQ